MSDVDAIAQRMREAWNGMAREDARFYIAFGRRQQDDAEFAATGAGVLRRIGQEFPRLPPATRSRRFLEIGCGIGRLMGPLSAACGEIHGVDISDEMVTAGRARLDAIPHAHLHWARNSDLSAFADAGFDLVYSYAVMQHLPDEAPFWRYLAEAARVLRPGGVLLEQFNSHVAGREAPDCWAGIVLSAQRVLEAGGELGLRVVALEGVGTQYTWLTAIRRDRDVPAAAPDPLARLQRVTGADQAEHVTAGGRTGVAELQVTGLDSAFHDLGRLRGRIGHAVVPVLRTRPTEDGTAVTLTVPQTVPCGQHRVSLEWNGAPASEAVEVTVRPFIRGAPAVLAVTDGIDLLSHTILSGVAKLWIRDLTDPAALRASLGGLPVGALDLHCEDTVDQRYQVNLAIPAGLPADRHRLDITVAESTIFSEPIDIQPHASG